MSGEWQYEEWQYPQKSRSNSSSSSFGGALNKKEEVDWSAIYGPSLGYGDIGYGDLGYGPSLEEMARSLQPTGTRRGVNWGQVTATPGVGQNSKANEDKPTVGMPQKQKSVPDATTEAFSAIPASFDETLQQQNTISDSSADQTNTPNANKVRTGGSPLEKSSRQPTGNRARPLTPVERFQRRLRGKALAQLYENELHILRVQAKYQKNPSQNQDNTEALGRLRQVVAADERLESTQKQLENRSLDFQVRLRMQTVRETAGGPPGTGPNAAQLQALIAQNQAKLNEIKQVRGTLLALYPASGLLTAGDVKETNSDAQLLATLNDRFENIRSNIKAAIKGIDSGDIRPERLEPLVAETLKETPEADNSAVTEYLQGERQRENTFRFFGFLAQIGLTVAAIFTGGLPGAVMGALASTMGIGQAIYEFEEASDLNTVAKTGQAGGNQLLADPGAARFNYIMGWVNVVLAGIDGGLAVREGAQLLVGARAAERLANQAGVQVLFRLPQEKLVRLQEAMRLEKAKDPGAPQLLASLRQELGADFDDAYKLFKEERLEVLDDAEASRIWGGMARPEGYWIRIIKGKISTVKEGAEEAFYVTSEQYDAIQELPKNQKRTREEIFQNLPPELREQASPTKTRRTIVEKPTRVRSDYLQEYENVVLGERIGSGGNKDVYAIQGRNDLAIGILRRGEIEELNTEIETLQKVESQGLQTIEVLGTTTHNGRPAIIMKKYAQGSKGIVRSIGGIPERVDGADISLLNQKSIDDLEKIRAILQRKKIYIDDLQFLIAEDGRVYITDPIDIKFKPTTREMDSNAGMIDLLLNAARENN
ncbi:hypothetical protein QUB37_13140 [Microcoleus sp. AT3-A2]|uniref:hypothetical protein n=1 Tax=unclassified Microcoleus TaxID=2642155 RepID=UPI002FD4A10D